MKNIITASIEFYFKGKKLTPTATIIIDDYMQATASFPDLYSLIARQNNIDLYSYEYEMMLAEPVHIEHAEGLIADYIIDGVLDQAAFENIWQENKIYLRLQAIAQQHMDIENLQAHPKLNTALHAAFMLGQDISREDA